MFVQRIPPPPPRDLPINATPEQCLQHARRSVSYWVGEHLRAMVAAQRSTIQGELPDSLSIPMTPRYTEITVITTHRTSDNMGAVIAYIDNMAEEVMPMTSAFQRLTNDFPRAARAAWMKHILLATYPEMAAYFGVSTATAERLVFAANMRIYAFARVHDLALSVVERRRLNRDADQIEAEYHRSTAPAGA